MASDILRSGTFILAVASLFLSVACPFGSGSSIVVGETRSHESVDLHVDFIQAEMVLSLLRSSADGKVNPEMIESVVNAHGTTLIISQQNISRSVTREQYRTLLLALTREELPEIVPVDGREKSRRGVEGLRKDVWPSLRWGRNNTNLLAERIEEIKRINLFRKSVALATRYLPEKVELSPRLYVVMGGRAGAAALEGDEIYFDVLATSYRAANGALQYPSPSQIGEYFAHELHHIGLSQIFNRTRRHLRLNNQEQLAFDLLTALVMEGSASYLINGQRSLEVMRHDPQFRENLKESDELLELSEQVLRSVLENNLHGEEYEKATTPFLGSGWHSTGAFLLAAIDRADGLLSVMRILRDPRELLVAYNQAISKLKTYPERHKFDTGLAKRVSSLGA